MAFTQWLQRVGEKLFGRFYEGEAPPARLREMVVHFANENPRATRAEWAEMAAALAEEAYRAGYTRGFERAERQPEEQVWKDLPPEFVADRLDPTWRWQRGITLVGNQVAVVKDERTEEEDMIAALKQVGGKP